MFLGSLYINAELAWRGRNRTQEIMFAISLWHHNNLYQTQISFFQFFIIIIIQIMYEGSKLSKRSFKDAWIKVFCGVSFFSWQKWFELDSVHPSLSAPAHMLSSYRLQYSCPVWKWTNLTSISNLFFIIINVLPELQSCFFQSFLFEFPWIFHPDVHLQNWLWLFSWKLLWLDWLFLFPNSAPHEYLSQQWTAWCVP